MTPSLSAMTPELEALAARDHDLSPDECVALAREASDLVDPAALADETARERLYELLWRNAHSEAWLMSFNEPRDTGYHDHDGSNGAVAVLEGRITEEPLVIGGPPRVNEYLAGDVLSFTGSHIHRMHHDTKAVTIHLYSPPIKRIGSYDVVDGALRRTPGSPDEESPATPGLDAALGV
jgi:Cysteine dioxygenase type I